jgi:hypothetical protein
MGHGGKGDSPRPFSVSQEDFGNRYETIFGKKNRMTPHVKDNGDDFGTCGCGRSPTGKCIGWHGLSEDEYQKRLAEFNQQDGNTAQ